MLRYHNGPVQVGRKVSRKFVKFKWTMITPKSFALSLPVISPQSITQRSPGISTSFGGIGLGARGFPFQVFALGSPPMKRQT